MTDFNNIARAQGQASDDRQFYDAQRYDAMRGQGAAMQQGSQAFVENRQRQQSLDNETARTQASLVQLQQELALRQREADMRVEEHEIGVQIMGQKLQAMQAIDQTDLGRAQVQQQQAAAKMAQIAAARAEKEFADMDRDRATEFALQHFRSRFPGGSRDVFEAGYIVDPSSPMGYRLPKDDDELRAFGSRIDQSRDRQGGAAGNPLLDRDRVSRELTRVQEQMLDATDPAEIEELESIAAKLRAEYRGHFGMSTAPAAPRAQQPQRAGLDSLEPSDRMAVESWAKNLSGATTWAGGTGIPPEKAEAIAVAVFTNREQLAGHIRRFASGGREITGDPRDIAREVMDSIARPAQTPTKDAMLAWLVTQKVLTAQEAQALWDEGGR